MAMVHFVTMVHIIYTIVCGWITYSVLFPVLPFLNFESTVVVRCHWFWLEKDEFEHA